MFVDYSGSMPASLTTKVMDEIRSLTVIHAGRTPLGIAYAHVTRGSEVLHTVRGLSRGRTINRARRWMKR